MNLGSSGRGRVHAALSLRKFFLSFFFYWRLSRGESGIMMILFVLFVFLWPWELGKGSPRDFLTRGGLKMWVNVFVH